jgi:uncharacterized protein (DUF302 family)
MTYTLSTDLRRPYAESVAAVRAALTDQGFGVLTEIDLAATLKAKLGVDVPPQVILGACRPDLAHEALRRDPSLASVLPCNVVVRVLDEQTTRVEAFDPAAMTELAGEGLRSVADDARRRLLAALSAVGAGRTSLPQGTSGSDRTPDSVPSVIGGQPRP